MIWLKFYNHIANLEFKKLWRYEKGFKDTAETAKKDFEALGDIVINAPKVEGLDGGGEGGKKPKGLASLGDSENSPLKIFCYKCIWSCKTNWRSICKCF